MCSTLMIKCLGSKRIFLLYFIYFKDIQNNKVSVELGVFSNSNELKMCSEVNPKVWLWLISGCGLN